MSTGSTNLNASLILWKEDRVGELTWPDTNLASAWKGYSDVWSELPDKITVYSPITSNVAEFVQVSKASACIYYEAQLPFSTLRAGFYIRLRQGLMPSANKI